MVKSLCLLWCLWLYGSGYVNAKEIRQRSPDGNIVFTLKDDGNLPQFRIVYKGKTLINFSEIGLRFADGLVFGKDTKTGKARYRSSDEHYELLVGKTKKVRNKYNEIIIPFAASDGRTLELVVRLFNDGAAFRYQFPAQANWKSYTLTDELTTYSLNENPTVLSLFLPNYLSSHEGLYSRMPFSEIPEDTLIEMPVLFEYPGNIFMAITEADLVDFAGMYLQRAEDHLVSRLSPLPGQAAIKVKAVLPHRSPWRVMMIGDRIGALIESDILTNLTEPSSIQDLSWIKPGKTTFPWWNGTIIPDTTFAPGNNFETQKYYIDFCAENGLEYHSVVEGGGHEWYMNDGTGYQPGENVDVTKEVPGIDMKQICDYAQTKGVGIRVWVHWKALYPKLDEAFALFEKWGLKGMMVDFMDRDDQEMVNIQIEILQKAAKHKLHIQFHGSYKPTGLHRTYPNEFTREGTLNYEVNKWGVITPDHDINIPFTRMLAGSTDYHLGGFRAVPEKDYKIQYTRPLMMGTRCHQLAMYVVLENYLGMVCDYPDAYKGQPGFDFIKEVPTVWHATKVPGARVGEYISIARRHGDNWYVGTITNSTPRSIEIVLDFLEDGEYEAETYSDHKDGVRDPNLLEKKIIAVKKGSKVNINMLSGGGHVMKIKRKA